jgi:hypothetical protein
MACSEPWSTERARWTGAADCGSGDAASGSYIGEVSPDPNGADGAETAAVADEDEDVVLIDPGGGPEDEGLIGIYDGDDLDDETESPTWSPA